MSLLETDDLSVTFGGVRAVDRVSLSIEPGTVVGLIGPNGAGKTTFVDALAGFVPTRGRITFDGERIDGLSAFRRARAGLARTWQSLELFNDLTVVENLNVAVDRPTAWSPVLDLLRPRRAGTHSDTAQSILEACGLAEFAERMPAELSLGQQKLVGVARALAATPKLVLLDEPAAGLDPTESRAFGTRLRNLCSGELTMLLIDHDMDLVLSVCDRVYVLEFGRIIAEGPPQLIRNDPRVIEAYLGGAAPVGAAEPQPLTRSESST